MILALLQITALLLTAYKLMTFRRGDYRYRFFVSLVASCWAGGCLALSVAMILSWPDAVESSNAVTAALSGVSLGAAWFSGGNVAKVIRWCKLAR